MLIKQTEEFYARPQTQLAILISGPSFIRYEACRFSLFLPYMIAFKETGILN